MIYFLELPQFISDLCIFFSISNQLANYGGILKVHIYWNDLFLWRSCYVLMASRAMYLMKTNDLFSRISKVSISYTLILFRGSVFSKLIKK